MAATARAEDKEEIPAPPFDVREVDRTQDRFKFMQLGVKTDFLRVERHRIADQIQQFIPPLYEPALPFHAYTLPPGAFRAMIETSVFNNDRDFGRDPFYSLFFSDVKVRNTVITYKLLYGFELPMLGAAGRDLVLNVEVPYRRTNIRGTGHPFRIDPFVMSMTGDAEGFGDIVVAFKKKWADQGNSRINVASVMGVIAPTGRHRESFNDAQSLVVNGMPMPPPPINVFSSKSTENFLPNDAQPGTGSWGGRAGLMLTRQFEHSAAHVGAVANLFARNQDGILPGNELRFGAAYVFPVFPHRDILSLDVSFFGRSKRAERFPGTIMHPERDPATGGPIMDSSGNVVMFATSRPAFEHGTVAFVQPSLIFSPTPQTRLVASPSLRVIEPDRGPSPRLRYSASLEVTY